tara:strand:- start:1955 stop:2335 length:381 start_codon:yes stop_codon:yes gene_type:complete
MKLNEGPSVMPEPKKLTIKALEELLLRERLKTAYIEAEFNNRYVERADRRKEELKQACIKRGLPELAEAKPPPITLLNHRHNPDPKLFGEKYSIIPQEARIPILLYGMIPHFTITFIVLLIALFDF